jgi:hypothetical protein
MMPRRACTGIDCPIGLYERHDGEIRRLTQAINGSSTVSEMSRAAHDLRQHACVLLDCRAYDGNDPNCRMCRDISAWREKTASVVGQMTTLPP